MKNKSILILGNYPPPYGGVPRHIEYLVPYLTEKGWDVHILSVGNTGISLKDGFTVYRPSLFKTIGAFIRSIIMFNKAKKFNSSSSLFSVRSLVKYLRYMAYIQYAREIIKKNKINIISAYNLFAFAPIGAALSEELNVPLVVTNFGEIYQDTEYAGKNISLVKYICKVSKRLLAMSNHCAEGYKLLGLLPKIDVIPYGVDIDKFSPLNTGIEIRNRFGVNKDDKIVIFIGRLKKDMGLHILLEAIPDVISIDNKFKFFLVGEKGELLPFALRLSERYPKNIFVMPSVPFKELPFYYAASDVVVAPTAGERACGSLAAIEGMATGKPVIASRVGGIPEIVIDGETGILVSPNDPRDLSGAILKLLQNESEMKRMGKLGRERAKNYFDENKTDEKLEQLFRETAGL